MNGEGYELYYEERLPTVVFGGGHMEMRMARMAKTLSMGTAHAVSDATILRNDSNLPAADAAPGQELTKTTSGSFKLVRNLHGNFWYLVKSLVSGQILGQ